MYNDDSKFEKTGNILLDELIFEEPADEMENTLELDTLKLTEEEEKELKGEEKKEKKKKSWFHLPITTAQDHHLEYAFVHCTILASITALIGTGMITFIISHI